MSYQTVYSTYAAAARERRSQKVEGRRLAIALSVIAVAALIGILYLTQASQIVAAGYRLQALETELARMQRQNDQLLYEIAQWENPQRILKRAKELKMVPIRQGEFVVVPGLQTAPVVVPAPPTPTPTPAPPEIPWWQRLLGQP